MKFIQNCILWEHCNLWSRQHHSIPHTKHQHTLIYLYTCKTLLTAFKYETIQEKIQCAKNRFIEFLVMYVGNSYINNVYVHTLKINSEKLNMYVVGSYIKYVYDVIYLNVVCSYIKYIWCHIYSHVKKFLYENIIYMYMKTMFIQ